MVKNWLRAWLNVLGFFIVAVAVIAIGGFSYLYLRKPAMAPPVETKVEITPARLARGNLIDFRRIHVICISGTVATQGRLML